MIHYASEVEKTMCHRRPRKRRSSGTEPDQRMESEDARNVVKVLECCQKYVLARRLASSGIVIVYGLVNIWYIG